MGREIRMVPPNWSHPLKDGWSDGRLQPMYDKTFADAAAEWINGFTKWQAGERPSYYTESDTGTQFWEYEGEPPDREYYRPWNDAEATWFQVWETVSEGTPVSPPFATEDELVGYLAEHGDFWDQSRAANPRDASLYGFVDGKCGWGREAAERFVKRRWAPSMIVQDGVVTDGKLAS